MLPFFDEFDKGQQVALHDLAVGDYALILSLNSKRALVVRITRKEEEDWVGGSILAPAMSREIADTFSRKGGTIAVRIEPDSVLALLEKYTMRAPMSELKHLTKTEKIPEKN